MGPLYSGRGSSGSGPKLGGFGGKGIDMATSAGEAGPSTASTYSNAP